MFDYAEIAEKRVRLKTKEAAWIKGLGALLLIVSGWLGTMYALNQGSAGQLMRILSEQEIPLEIVFLEGAAGYSQPQRVLVENARHQGISLGMFLLTGVNIADARTFFLNYFSPPPEGPVWLGWAYNPKDPEREGEIVDLPEKDSAEKVKEQNEQNIQERQNSEDTQETAPPPGLAGKILVGIYHTHNAESYAGNGGSERKEGNGDIVAVGKVLKEQLLKRGIGTAQSLAIHDATDFMKAYSASLKTAAQMLEENASLILLLDLHRDGLPPGVKKSTAPVNGKEASRILIVIGKKNPHWSKNEALAKELMALGEEKYPGLFAQNISYAAEARYNQHLADGALLIEFGSQLNSLAESEIAAAAFAEILADWLERHSLEE
ncbi:MAG: stage II sporulation protein P [Peptococcaceae bacterium]|nr:stage II sporulation protein P [Peptococcaceae bacterium]